MPFISLDLKCTMVGVTDLKPSEPDSFRWYIKVKCTSCGEFSDKWQYVTSNEVLEVPGSRGEANMVMKCKLCSRVNTLSILPESFGKYSLEKNEQWQSLLAFDSRGLEIVDFDPRLAWEATGAETNQPFNDIDLSEKIWADYDEKAGEAVEITNIEPHMMEMGDEVRNDVDHEVEVRKENAKEVYSILKAVQFREYGTFHFAKTGMRIVCDDNHCQQAAAYIEQSVFKSFELKDDVTFRVPLLDVTEVIGMLDGNNVTLKLMYDGYGFPLRLSLAAEEDEYVVQANIHTLEAETIQDFGEEFNANEIRMSTIIRPEILKDAVKAIDDSCTVVTILAKPLLDGEGGKVSFISKGDIGKVTTTFTSSSSMVERIEVPDLVRYNYNVRLFKRMQYALTISNKVAIRIDCHGTLCAQFLLERQDAEQIFIEFYCLSEQDET